MPDTKIKLPKLKIAHGYEDLFALRGKMLYFVFGGVEKPIPEAAGTDRKIIGLISEAGWQRRSDWLWDRMLNYPSNKSKAYRRLEQEYDEADLQILAWRAYSNNGKKT